MVSISNSRILKSREIRKSFNKNFSFDKQPFLALFNEWVKVSSITNRNFFTEKIPALDIDGKTWHNKHDKVFLLNPA